VRSVCPTHLILLGLITLMLFGEANKTTGKIIGLCIFVVESRDSSVGIALGHGLDDRGSRVRFPAEAGNFSLHHRVQDGSGAHPASHPMGKRGSFPGGKAAGAQSWLLISILCRGQECVELYLHSPNTSSWSDAYLSTGTTLPSTFLFLSSFQRKDKDRRFWTELWFCPAICWPDINIYFIFVCR
jgi:hypothetical protein